MWSNDLRTWIKPPKVTETQLILPGEGRIYRRRGLIHLEALDLYKRLALPVSERTNHGAQLSSSSPPAKHPRIATTPHSNIASSSAQSLDEEDVNISKMSLNTDVGYTGKGKAQATEIIEVDDSDQD